MLYYRAKKDAYDYFLKNGVIENELLTARERDKNVRYLPDNVFDLVSISKNNTFFSFGVRFEYKGGTSA